MAEKGESAAEEYDVSLSDQAIQNLRSWYKQDFEFYRFCKKLETSSEAIRAKKMTQAATISSSSKNAKVSGSRPFLRINSDSDKLMELTQYWTPPISPWQPLKKSLNSGLRMACVVEDRVYRGLRFEGHVMLLTPANWKHLLKHSKPDILLMESIWNTSTGHWHMGQCTNAPGRDELLEIVALARKLSIPTVFWITKGHEYHEHYKDFARNFDFVFCADPTEAELLQAEGIKAEVLLPCIQPAIYNPFRHYEDYNAFSLGMLYDGWADLDRMTDELNVLKEVKPYGLNIIESRYQIFRRRMDVLPEYKDCILGCVSEQDRIQALRYAKAYITLDKTLSTKTTQQWKTLEAAACRLPVVHHGSLADDDVRKRVVIDCPQEMEFLVEFVRFREDDLYRERMGHLGWRKTFQEHTFAHRMHKICKTIGIEHDWVEYPKTSLITPTFRSELLPRCFQTFEQQTYPNKELVLVFNGQNVPSYSELGLDKPISDVKIANVPGEMFAGACLNQGHILADGEYCFRIDDDDYYGPNYILDMILQARCIDADLFGKPPVPLLFEGEQKVYWRDNFPPLCIVNTDLLASGKVWIGGNSIAGRIDLFRELEYDDFSYGAADSSLLYKLSRSDYNKTALFMDRFNIVAVRSTKQQVHTWKVAAEKIKNNAQNSCILPDIML